MNNTLQEQVEKGFNFLHMQQKNGTSYENMRASFQEMAISIFKAGASHQAEKMVEYIRNNGYNIPEVSTGIKELSDQAHYEPRTSLDDQRAYPPQ